MKRQFNENTKITLTLEQLIKLMEENHETDYNDITLNEWLCQKFPNRTSEEYKAREYARKWLIEKGYDLDYTIKDYVNKKDLKTIEELAWGFSNNKEYEMICPYCGSRHVCKKGYSINGNQRFVCIDCKKTIYYSDTEL